MPNNMLRNPPFCSFTSFAIVSLTTGINKPNSSRDITIYIISSISSFEINVVIPDTKVFFWIAASFADAAVVYPNGIKTLLANGRGTFFYYRKIIFK